MARRPSLSAAALAQLRLREIARLGKLKLELGEKFETGPLLMVITNLLSSIPRSQLPEREGVQPPAYPLALIIPVVMFWAYEAGVRVSSQEASGAIKNTKAWRQRISEKRGKVDRRPMAMDTIGKKLGVTPELREEAKAWNIGTIGGTSAQRAKAWRARKVIRHRERERERGVMPRSIYLANSLSRKQPWVAEGISRRTWERRRSQRRELF